MDRSPIYPQSLKESFYQLPRPGANLVCQTYSPELSPSKPNHWEEFVPIRKRASHLEEIYQPCLMSIRSPGYKADTSPQISLVELVSHREESASK